MAGKHNDIVSVLCTYLNCCFPIRSVGKREAKTSLEIGCGGSHICEETFVARYRHD